MAEMAGVDAREANFTRADMRGCSLERGKLNGAILVHARMSTLSLNGNKDSDVLSVNLTRASLVNADLSFADMSGAIFYMADLSFCSVNKSVFRCANLVSTKLFGLDVDRADFSGANTSGAIGMTKSA
jgi:uncharacterized protein YjbI with pentapeptide repeats